MRQFQRGTSNENEKRGRILSALLVMASVILLLSGCVGNRAEKEEKEDAETITVYLWSTNLY